MVDREGKRLRLLMPDTKYRTEPSRVPCVKLTARTLHKRSFYDCQKFGKREPKWFEVADLPTCSALGSRAGACGNPKVQLTSPCPSYPMQDQRFLYKRCRPRSHPYSPSPSVKRSALGPSHLPRSQCCLPDRARNENAAEQARAWASSSLDIPGGGGSSIARTLAQQLSRQYQVPW